MFDNKDNIEFIVGILIIINYIKLPFIHIYFIFLKIIPSNTINIIK